LQLAVKIFTIQINSGYLAFKEGGRGKS